jgi:4-amino-4-deoxy-L-arabinose transferase-like glycosyltransferase
MASASLTAPRFRARASALGRRPELWLLLALALVLYLWALSRNGWANTYYSAAVRSMSSSWHAFLYGSFDASGLMTVDKPPLALWVQALSARIFGFSSWSMLVPQALMGVATVGLAYDLVRRRFGRLAGFVGGVALAVTPVWVAIARYNNPDTLLVLCCVAAAWFVVRGLEDGRTRWIVLAGVSVGLGFEAKMGAALLIVPALAVAWLWAAPGRLDSSARGSGGRLALADRLRALRQLLVGGLAMAVVGLAWPVLMWLTPASDRPWISGTSNNDIWSLIFGYNGLGRLLGQSGGPGGGVGGPGVGPGGGGGPFGGSPGVLRLLNESLGGQAGWFVGAALVAAIGIAVASRLRRGDARTGWVIAVGGSFVTIAVAFSTAKGIFHPYYTSQLAPFAAALVGAGAGSVVRGGRRAAVVGTLGIAAAVACEIVIFQRSGADGWLAPLVIVGGALAAGVLVFGVRGRARTALVAAVVALFLVAPAKWAVETLGHGESGPFPSGGPVSQSMGLPGTPLGNNASPGAPGALPGNGASPPGGGFAGGPPGGGFAGNSSSLSEAVAYAKAHGGGTVAVSSQSGAATSILSSDASVAGIGGFSGRESEVTAMWLADAVQSGKVRWVLADAGGGFNAPADGRTGAKRAMAAVTTTCKQVSSVSGLYDCSGHAAALRSA